MSINLGYPLLSVLMWLKLFIKKSAVVGELAVAAREQRGGGEQRIHEDD